MKANRAHWVACTASVSAHPQAVKTLASLGMGVSYCRGQEICAQGHAVESLYRLVSGAARSCVMRSDGRRQIVDLLLQGDFFGFAVGAEYDYTVEAIAADTVVVAYARKRVEVLADQDSELARELRQLAVEALARMQAQLLIVGRITALEKVASFLLEMSDRLGKEQADRVILPVSRYDIADYLAVSVETVSRALTDLNRRGLIALSGPRNIKIIDRAALKESDRIGHVTCQGAGRTRMSWAQ